MPRNLSWIALVCLGWIGCAPGTVVESPPQERQESLLSGCDEILDAGDCAQAQGCRWDELEGSCGWDRNTPCDALHDPAFCHATRGCRWDSHYRICV